MSEESALESLDDLAIEQAQRSLAAAHRPASSVAGGYGRPIHPLLVTIPIGAFVATVAFDVASVAIEGRAYGRPAAWLAAIGVVSGAVAAMFGLVDLGRLTKGTRARAVAIRHLQLMLVVLACFTASFLVRQGDPDQYLDGTPPLAIALAVIGLIALLAGGALGGQLSYRHGVRVVDETDQLPGHVISTKNSSGGSSEPTD